MPLTPDHLSAAESLLGLHFSPAQREQMLQTLSDRLAHFDSIRAADLENSVPPPLHFNPIPSDPDPAPVPRKYAISPQPATTRPDSLDDIAFLPITRLAQLIRGRKVSSLELTRLYLDRLERYDPQLYCVACLTEERAIESAKRADDEIARGDYRGPLHGIPWGAKDLLATRGYPTGWGAMPFKDQVIDHDATVVRRLDEAGAVLVAKLTLGALANGEAWHGGWTRTPWATDQGSGGSSAGPGAATAAGLVGFSIGSETLGSIVSPSSRCGVTGMRPTFGRVSRDGAMALSWSMDKLGPMCRSVEDCALVFSAIYGPDGRDLSVSAEPFAWDPAQDPRQLRVAYVADAFETDETEDDAYARDSIANSAAALDVMRDLGLDLQPIQLPRIDTSPLYMILVAEAAAAFDQITRDDRVSTMRRQDDSAWPNVFRAARFIPAVEYINANRIRAQLMADMAAIMRDVDVFVVPSFAADVLPITNFTGHPAVVLPCGFSDSGIPTSISFIGGLNQETETLAVAKAYQDATDWHTRYPDLTASM